MEVGRKDSERENISSQWEEGLICPIHKRKGDRMVCENYRGICLLNTPYKVFYFTVSRTTNHRGDNYWKLSLQI
jgi:hypothetical protein